MDLLQVSSDGYCWKLWEMETNSQKEFCFSLVHVWMTDILGCAVLQDQTQARKAFHYLSLVPWEKTKLHANWLSCKGKIARVKQSKMATLEIKDDLAFNSATHEDASDFRCVSSFCLPLSSLLKTCLHKLTYFPTYTSPYMCGIFVQQRDCCSSYLPHKRQFHFRLHAKLSWLGSVQTKRPRNLSHLSELLPVVSRIGNNSKLQLRSMTKSLIRWLDMRDAFQHCRYMLPGWFVSHATLTGETKCTWPRGKSSCGY